jgi:GTP-binding protein HflX
MKRAAVLSLDSDLGELKSLLENLDVVVEREFIQKMNRPHKAGFLGPGKIEEVHHDTKDLHLDLIVINGVLRPSQHHFLEMKFQMECVDRPGVILKIFANHAHSPEAIAQVTLAKLKYELPFLREWIHKAKSGDRPGFLAGGAYATDVYYEHARTHTRKMEASLHDLTKRREATRIRRKEKGYSMVSLAGHTNVGKSALLNALSGSKVEVDDRMFSTLSTTTRRLPGSESRILLTDTVGFIRNLPPDLIDAFNSTLEEIFQADLVLLVFDSNEKESIIKDKLMTSLDILIPEVDEKNLILVGNKIDLISSIERKKLLSWFESSLSGKELFLVSAKTEEGLDDLRERISLVQDYSHLIEATAPQTDEVYSLLSRLRAVAKVWQSSTGPVVSIRILCKPQDRQKMESRITALGGQIVVSQNNAAKAPSASRPNSSGNEGVPPPGRSARV